MKQQALINHIRLLVTIILPYHITKEQSQCLLNCQMSISCFKEIKNWFYLSKKTSHILSRDKGPEGYLNKAWMNIRILKINKWNMINFKDKLPWTQWKEWHWEKGQEFLKSDRLTKLWLTDNKNNRRLIDQEKDPQQHLNCIKKRIKLIQPTFTSKSRLKFTEKSISLKMKKWIKCRNSMQIILKIWS